MQFNRDCKKSDPKVYEMKQPSAKPLEGLSRLATRLGARLLCMGCPRSMNEEEREERGKRG